MVANGQTTEATARCTLCPAVCELALTAAGPDLWRCEFPETAGEGLCPRGAAMGELLGHRDRILTPARRDSEGLQPTDMAGACRAILDAAGDKRVVFLLDGNVPLEQIAAAAAWCDAWPQAQLCLVIEPADEQLLQGTEASGADY
ncbi:hypothetical protein LCGC14_2642660, partial [marine sediment metagenome]